MGNFNNNLIRIMAELNLNQTQVADGSRIDRTLISKYCRKDVRGLNPSMRNVVKIAAFLSKVRGSAVTVEELMGEKQQLNKKEWLFLKIFTRNINRWMKIRNATQSDMARGTGISQATISRYCRADETGTLPGIYHLVAIADFLKISVADITGNSEHRQAEKEAAKIRKLTEYQLELLEAYESLPEDDPRRTAIDALLLGTKSSGKK